MKLSVIIPVYNEEKTVKDIIARVKSVNLNIKKEIIVVDDGSKDSSWEIINGINGLKKVKHTQNRGKGAAVRTAIKHSSGDIILIQDADMELDPVQIPVVIEPLINGKAKVVYGSRNTVGKDLKRSLTFYIGGHLITFFTNLFFRTNLTDEPCGYKAFDAKLIKKIDIENDRFEWEPEITAKISKMGVKIYEVPVYANSRSIKEGKKLRRRDGVKAFMTLIKYRFFK